MKGKRILVKGRDTDHDAAVVPSWKAGSDQTGHEVCRGRAVVPADTGGQRGHSSVVEVQRAAVCGVGVQRSQGRLPNLRKSPRNTQSEIPRDQDSFIQHTFCH